MFEIIMKYICLAMLIFNTLFLVFCIYNGTITNVIVSFINEIILIIQSMIWNEFSED